MKKQFLKIVSMLVFFMFGVIGTAGAIVFTFDDIPGASQDSQGLIPNPYHGFNFGCTNYGGHMDWVDTVGSAWDHGSISGDFTMLNNYWGGNVIITSSTGQDFVFNGVYARIWYDYNYYYLPELPVSIEGFNDCNLLWSNEYTLTQDWDYFAGVSTLKIDELRLNFGPSSYFLVDNLALNESNSVPEPCTMILLGTGLVGLIGTKLRKKKK